MQSNFGVVTKAGMWLMDKPESIVSLDMELDQMDDLGWAIDTLAPMRRSDCFSSHLPLATGCVPQQY